MIEGRTVTIEKIKNPMNFDDFLETFLLGSMFRVAEKQCIEGFEKRCIVAEENEER